MKPDALPHPTLDRYIVAARDAARRRIQSERAGVKLEAATLDTIWGDNIFYQLFTGKISVAAFEFAMRIATRKTTDLYIEFKDTQAAREDGNDGETPLR